jgi:hypothetical protein
MNDEYYYYAYCIHGDCKFFAWAESIQHAHTILKQHEKEFHKGKPLGTFGMSKGIPVNQIIKELILDIDPYNAIMFSESNKS